MVGQDRQQGSMPLSSHYVITVLFPHSPLAQGRHIDVCVWGGSPPLGMVINNAHKWHYHYLMLNAVQTSLHLSLPPPHREEMPTPSAAPGRGSHSPAHSRAPGGGREAPALLGPMQGSSQNQPSPSLAAPAVHSAAAAGLPPAGHPAPPSPQPACQEADGWAHVHCSCGARQHHAWLQGRWPVPGDNQRRQARLATVGLGPPLRVQAVLASPSSDQATPGQAVPPACLEGCFGCQPGTRAAGPVLTFQSPSALGLGGSLRD